MNQAHTQFPASDCEKIRGLSEFCKRLERFYKTGKSAGIQANHAKRLRLILTNLDQAESPSDVDLPGLRLHELKGSRKEIWSISVSGNWRVTFRFIGRDAEIVNYEDYH